MCRKPQFSCTVVFANRREISLPQSRLELGGVPFKSKVRFVNVLVSKLGGVPSSFSFLVSDKKLGIPFYSSYMWKAL